MPCQLNMLQMRNANRGIELDKIKQVRVQIETFKPSVKPLYAKYFPTFEPHLNILQMNKTTYRNRDG